MTFERSRKSDSDINKPTGELVVIEAADSKPKALIYASEMVEQRVKTEIREADDNIYKKGFIVDANVQSRQGRIVGYAVTAVHQVIDLPRSEEHTSELQSLMRISYAVFCLKKKNKNTTKNYQIQS